MTRSPKNIRPAHRNTASLYCRMSELPEERGTGLASQETDLRNLAAASGLTVVAVHIDEGLSGAIRNRPAFTAWLDDARDGRADHLLGWKLDRISRGGSAGLARFLDTIEGVNHDGEQISPKVRFLSYADHLDSESPSWPMQAAVLGAVAQGERDSISLRVKRSRRALKESGRFGGGTPPVGFTSVDNPDGGGRILVEDVREITPLKEAARILTVDGLKPATRWMNLHSGIRPRRAADWTRQSLQGALTSEAAQTIFTASERQLIKEALAPKAEKVYRGRAPTRLLSTVLHCASCGRTMIVATRERRKDSDAAPSKVYRCRSVIDGAYCRKRAAVSARLIEPVVEELFLEGWGRQSETVVVRYADEHRERLAEMGEQIDALYVQLGKAKGADRRAERTALTEEIDRLEAELTVAEQKAPSSLSKLIQTGRTLADAWLAGDVEERRELLKRCVGTLHVRPGKPGARVFDRDRISDRRKFDPADMTAVGPDDFLAGLSSAEIIGESEELIESH
jgi:site-specific DNA recombinase